MFVSLDKTGHDRLGEDEFLAAGEEVFAAIHSNMDSAAAPDERNQAPRATRSKLLR